MTQPAPEVLLTMPARPEGVGVVRQALAGMADALDFDPTVLADMKMAVTEACTNVVVHAYDQDAGMLEVEMLADEMGLTIVVRDHGAGIQPRPTRSEAPALGLGLPLIAALSDAFELRGSTRRSAAAAASWSISRPRPSWILPSWARSSTRGAGRSRPARATWSASATASSRGSSGSSTSRGSYPSSRSSRAASRRSPRPVPPTARASR